MPPVKTPTPATIKEEGFTKAVVALTGEVRQLREGLSSFEGLILQLQKDALKAATKKATAKKPRGGGH
jgi:hypothetical protein